MLLFRYKLENKKMNSSSPKISIIVPNYNYAHFLDKRIESILKQTYTDYEIILLDDASTDDSVKVLEKYKDNPHISQFVINEQNTGSPFKQWMKGILLAKGEWVWIAEADDLCEPTFLEICMHYINMESNVTICNTGSVYIDTEDNIMKGKVYQWEKNENKAGAICFDGKKFAEYILYWKNDIPNASGVLFKKEYALNIHNKKWTDFRYCGDWLFWFEMAMQGKVIQIYQTLNYFRQHQSQTAKGKYNGQNFIESFKIGIYIEKKIPTINHFKRMQKHGRDARIIKHIKNKEIRESIIKDYKKYLHSSFIKDYLYYKLNRHFHAIPKVLTEKKDRKKALKYSKILS